MKRLLLLLPICLSTFAGAQTVTSHEGYIWHSVRQSFNNTFGTDGTPYGYRGDTGLNGDTGLFTSNYSHVGSASSVTVDVTGRSKNALDAVAKTYKVDLSASLSYSEALSLNGEVSVDSRAVDTLYFHLDTPMRFNLAWAGSSYGFSFADNGLRLFDSWSNPYFSADLSHTGSTSRVLGSGDYYIVGYLERYQNASGKTQYPGVTGSAGGTLNYQVSFVAAPEPSSLAALGLGAVAFLRRRKK